MKRKIAALLLAALAVAPAAHAVPWCWKGTIAQVGPNQYLSPTQLQSWWTANGVPVGVANPHYYVAFHASHQRCQVYAGWTGPTYNVPGAGQVQAHVYAPSSYLSTLNGYTISQGLWFKCMKCYPIMEAEPVPDPVEIK